MASRLGDQALQAARPGGDEDRAEAQAPAVCPARAPETGVLSQKQQGRSEETMRKCHVPIHNRSIVLSQPAAQPRQLERSNVHASSYAAAHRSHSPSLAVSMTLRLGCRRTTRHKYLPQKKRVSAGRSALSVPPTPGLHPPAKVSPGVLIRGVGARREVGGVVRSPTRTPWGFRQLMHLHHDMQPCQSIAPTLRQSVGGAVHTSEGQAAPCPPCSTRSSSSRTTIWSSCSRSGRRRQAWPSVDTPQAHALNLG